MTACYQCGSKVPVYRDRPDPPRNREGQPVVFCCHACECGHAGCAEDEDVPPAIDPEDRYMGGGV